MAVHVGDEVERAGVPPFAAGDGAFGPDGFGLPCVEPFDIALDVAGDVLGHLNLIAVHESFAESVHFGAADGGFVAGLPGHAFECGDHGAASHGA